MIIFDEKWMHFDIAHKKRADIHQYYRTEKSSVLCVPLVAIFGLGFQDGFSLCLDNLVVSA